MSTRAAAGGMLSEDVEQAAVLGDDSCRLLITAPPGSGKTLTALRLAARDLDAGRVGPTQRVLLLTFSLQARAQLEGYAARLLSSQQLALLEITNYHAWFWRKVWQFRSSLGLPLELELSTEAKHREDVMAAMIKVGLVGAGAEWDDSARDYGVGLEHEVEGCRPDRLEAPLPEIDRVGEELRRVHRQGRLHYDDLGYYMWRLADESETLRRIWRHKYPVIVLDEYQDASAMQAKIIGRIAGAESRVYAFADPLQMIYGWRDASPRRIDDFKARGASVHALKTLHRYRDRPELQGWMEGVRDILLSGEGSCPPRPKDVGVIVYDPTERIRGEPYDIASRHLYRLDDPISRSFKDPSINSIAVLLRKHSHLVQVERHLTKRFFCKRLRTARETAEWVREWTEAFPAATSDQLKMARLMEVARRIAPRNEDLEALDKRIDVDGIRTAGLRVRRKALATELNAALDDWTDLAGACLAAQRVARIATEHEADERLIAQDAAYVVRIGLQVRPGIGDREAKEKVFSRLAQMRFTTEGREPRGLYLLTCHEAKGREFDMVILPYVSDAIFPDDEEEQRQLLYVALTRARQRLLIRTAGGRLPKHCEAMGLAL
jgi:superfamily I DNA/RNA helicase